MGAGRMSGATAGAAARATARPGGLGGVRLCDVGVGEQLVGGGSQFHAGKVGAIEFDALKDPLERLPFTTRQELEADQVSNPPYGTNLTYPLAEYCRFFQTSG